MGRRNAVQECGPVLRPRVAVLGHWGLRARGKDTRLRGLKLPTNQSTCFGGQNLRLRTGARIYVAPQPVVAAKAAGLQRERRARLGQPLAQVAEFAYPVLTPGQPPRKYGIQMARNTTAVPPSNDAAPERDCMAPGTEPTDEELACVMREVAVVVRERKQQGELWLAQQVALALQAALGEVPQT